MLEIEWPFETHMVKIKKFCTVFRICQIFYFKDFRGQKMAERLFQVVVSLFGVRFYIHFTIILFIYCLYNRSWDLLLVISCNNLV